MSSSVLLLNLVLVYGLGMAVEMRKLRFQADWLGDPEHVRLWGYIQAYISGHRVVPTPAVIANQFPHFPLLPPASLQGESAAVHIDILRNNYLRAQIQTLTEQAYQQATLDPVAAMRNLDEQIRALGQITAPPEAEDLALSGREFLTDYFSPHDGEAGAIAWPWPSIQQGTLGMNREDLIIIAGRPGSMKSMLAIEVAAHAYLAGARVLFLSREMSKSTVRRRFFAALARVDYGLVRTKKLPEEESERLCDMIHNLKALERPSPRQPSLHNAFFLVKPSRRNKNGLDMPRILIEEYMPDLFIDDGMYLATSAMEGGMDWKNVSLLTQTAKDTAAETKVTYLATTQANRRASSRGSDADVVQDQNAIAFGDSFTQDSDIVLRVLLKRDPIPHLALGFPKCREAIIPPLYIDARPFVSMREFTKDEVAQLGLDLPAEEEPKRRRAKE